MPVPVRGTSATAAPRRRLICAAVCVAFFVVVGLLPGVASAAYTWQNVPIIAGGYNPGIIFNDSQQDLIYARHDIGGAYRWDPASESWIQLLEWIGHDDWNLCGIVSLATDPVDTNRVYLAAGTYTNWWTDQNGAILRSADYGETWQRTDLPFKLGGNMPGRGAGERLVVDPNDNSILFLGAPDGNGLWKSTDYGVTWSQVTSFPNPGDYCQDPLDYWNYLNVPDGLLWATFDPTTGSPGSATQTIYVGVADKDNTTIYRTTDGSANWELLPGQPLDFPAPIHGVLDTVNGYLYITYGNSSGPYDGSLGAVWRYNTTDGTWLDITPYSESDQWFGYGGMTVDRQNPSTVMCTSYTSYWPDEWAWRSNDCGLTWSCGWKWTHYPNYETEYEVDISAAPWMVDFGDTGTQPPQVNPKFGWMVGDIEIDPFNSNRFMYGTGAQIYGTSNALAWDDADTGTKVYIEIAAQGTEETSVVHVKSPPAGAHLVSGILDTGGYRHDDLAAVPSLSHGAPGIGAQGLDFAELDPTRWVRVGTYSWVEDQTEDVPHSASSTSSAQPHNWAAMANIDGITGYGGGGSVALNADGSTVVWAPEADPGTDDDPATWFDVPVSYSNGLGRQASWTACAGIPVEAKVASDRVNPNKFYGFKNGTFYVSTDAGVSFAATATNLPPEGNVDFHAVPGFEGDVWLAGGGDWDTTDYGLWRSTDSGATFTKLANVEEADTVGFGKAADGQTYPAIYISAQIAGVRGFYRSIDGGSSWVRINDDQHQWGATQCISGDPRVFGRVFIGTNGFGIIIGEPETGDTTPPAAPTNLTATAVSSSQIDLDWDDNTEPDLASYNVYRDTVRIATDVTVSQYSDTGLSPSTQYCYTVTAVDTSENESDESNQACATTEEGVEPTTCHVDSIVCSTESAGQGQKRGVAGVVILDDQGGVVSNATVTGTFTGDFNETQSAVTDSSGLAVLKTDATKRGGVSFTFCVDDVTHATLTYDSNDNVETCDSL